MPCTPERVWRAIQVGSVDPWREPPAVFATLPVRTSPSDAAEGGEI
jgi:carbon-monoxide dehydrogenase large subunit